MTRKSRRQPTRPDLRRWYPAVAERAGHRCEYCRAPEPLFNRRFEVEHVIPRAREGKTRPDNLALCCSACNNRKGTFETGADPVTQRIEPLFNPRTQRWEEHFRYRDDALTLVALTPIGRATLARLDMNSDRQRNARRLWRLHAEVFP